MVESHLDDFETIRERFERLLYIPEAERTEENIFELMRLTAKFKIFETFKMSDMHREICRKIYIKEFEKGQIIFKQGDDGDAYYFVLRGCVDLYMYDVDQIDGKTKLKFLASVLPGNGFGELSLLYDCPRTATAIPNSSTDLVVFKKKLYNRFVKDLHEKDLLELIQFYYSIPIFRKEPISNILKYCLRTNKKIVNSYEPFLKIGDLTNEYFFVKSGNVKAFVKIKINQYLLRNIQFMDENKFVTILKNLQNNKGSTRELLPNWDINNPSVEKENIYKIYEEVLDIMEFNDRDMFAEFYASKNKRVDAYFLPTLPTEIICIKCDEVRKINPSLNEAIIKFSLPVFGADRIFSKFYKTLTWKKTKSKLLFNAIKKK